MRIQVCLEDEHVTDARFARFGCVPAIAAGSFLTDRVRGRTADEARAFAAKRLLRALGGLPESRRFCAELAVDALHAALADAASRSGAPGPVGSEPVEGAVRTDVAAEVRIGLMVADAFYEQAPQNHAFISMGHVAAGPRYRAQVVTGGTSQVDATQSSSDTSGKFRITRSGSTVNLYYWTGTGWSTALANYSSFVSSPVYVSLILSDLNGIGTMRLRNFTLNSPATSYPTTGTYTSAIYDAARPDSGNPHDLRTMTWDWLSWQASSPVGTSVRFQVASSSIPSPAAWTFVGPDGTSDTTFTSPAELPVLLSLDGNRRYLRYQATFTGDGTVTPVLYRVDVGFSGTTTPTLITYDYDLAAFCYDYARYDEATLDGVTGFYDVARYDESFVAQGAAGNLTRKVTETPVGITTEVRDALTWPASDRVNALNQIQRADITPPGGSTTSWRYTYDASGNLTSKTDGTNTWLYSWNDDNRLIQVTLPGGATVSYTYDMLGRMLTRTTSSPATIVKFEWDGWDCIREYTSPSGTATYDSAHVDTDVYGSAGVTLYYVVNGELLAFERDNTTYQVHADALGSVRMVTGSDGATLASFDYDAWGNLLDSSYDNVPGGGLAYGFVGALGVRWDAGTGLHYMRHRWYDAGLGRFISRDPLFSSDNLYRYVDNSATTYVDPVGLQGPEGSLLLELFSETGMRRAFARNTGCCEAAKIFGMNASFICSLAYHEHSFYDIITMIQNCITIGTIGRVNIGNGGQGTGTIGVVQMNERDVLHIQKKLQYLPMLGGQLLRVAKTNDLHAIRLRLLDDRWALLYFAAWQSLGVSQGHIDPNDFDALSRRFNPKKPYQDRWNANKASLLSSFTEICSDGNGCA